MIKKLLALLVMILATRVEAETMSQHLLQDQMGYDISLLFDNKLNIKAAQAICLRMFNIAKSRNVQIVLKGKSGEDIPVTEGYCRPDNNDVRFVMFVTIEAAHQLNIETRKTPYDCKEWFKINFAESYFERNVADLYYMSGWARKGQIDVQCSDNDNRCVVNRKIEKDGKEAVAVSCIVVGNFNCSTNKEGQHIINSSVSSTSEGYRNVLTRSLSLSDFNKSCKPLF